jgi:RimJ/RimL family protein N-acetyltransferase
VTRIAGARVTLRAYRDDEATILATTWADATWFAPEGTSPRELAERVRERIRRSGSFTDGMMNFAVEAEGRLIGEVSARQPIHGLPPGVFELGIELFEQGDRGRGLGADAIVENAAMRRVAERLGFHFEGVLRSFMPEPDGPHDYALYAITTTDLEGRTTPWI